MDKRISKEKSFDECVGLFKEFLCLNQISPTDGLCCMLCFSVSICKAAEMDKKEFLTEVEKIWESTVRR